MMREDDLICSCVIGNYLLGRAPAAFNTLHWNADSTRLPARLLTDFLRNYMENSLVKPGYLQLAGRRFDLRQIRTPCYFLSTLMITFRPRPIRRPKSSLARCNSLSVDPVTLLGSSIHLRRKNTDTGQATV
jgi:hypothetical protein